MSYGCYAWYENLTPDEEGTTLADLWNDRECNLWVNATANINRETGEVDDYEQDWGADLTCGEHDHRAIEKTVDDITHDIDYDSPYYLCEEGHDGWQALVFPTEAAYDLHREQEHEEVAEEDELQPATATPMAPATNGHRAHPRLTPTQRKLIQTFFASRGGRENVYQGLLVPRFGEIDRVMHASRTTEEYIRQYERDFPGHFWINRDDPHITTPSGNSLHARWS